MGVLRRLHKLQQKHEQRVAVAQRARAAAEDEVVWDDDPRSPSPAASPRPARIGVPSPAKVKLPSSFSCLASKIQYLTCWYKGSSLRGVGWQGI